MARKFTPAQLRKLAVTLRATVDQGEFVPEDDHTLLDQVLDDDEALVEIEEQYPLLYNALLRCDEDYVRQVEATNHIECSLDAIDAIVALVGKGGMPAAEPDADADETPDSEDPDADLAPERN